MPRLYLKWQVFILSPLEDTTRPFRHLKLAPNVASKCQRREGKVITTKNLLMFPFDLCWVKTKIQKYIYFPCFLREFPQLIPNFNISFVSKTLTELSKIQTGPSWWHLVLQLPWRWLSGVVAPANMASPGGPTAPVHTRSGARVACWP